MPEDDKTKLRFEIGHVLFIDIVGYSKLLINEQTEGIQKLTELVRGTEQVRLAEAEGELLRLPTGDGGALVFRNSPEAPVLCALEIGNELKKHPELRVRMGIHSGPVKEVADLNEQSNIAGAGINIAQRVMNCGDAGHILLSRRVADDLEQYPQWRPYLHALGGCEVKHGVQVEVFNLYIEEIGNPAIPARFKKPKDTKKRGAKSNSISKKSHAPLNEAARPSAATRWAGIAAGILILAIFAIWLFRSHGSGTALQRAASPMTGATTALSAPEKSIAVLPFENLSSNKENAYFADGVQDEILTDLAKIADLKVISRSSVMQYRTGLPRNLREIGRQLGVSHLLEGSVQRAAGKVRVNAQLIDARTDAHLWAQTYDRDLADIFAIQSDIARSIAGQLEAKLAPEEKARIVQQPTANPEAYLFYMQANQLAHVAASKQDALDAENLYTRAIALDPKFALAEARASIWNGQIYFMGRQLMRKNRARAQAEEALRLAPDLGEAHLALGLCYYRLDGDYEKALHELDIASAALPNNSEILNFSGYIYRRQGRWREALAVFQRARELDPRTAAFAGIPDTLRLLRRWTAASKAYQHGLELEPQLADGWLGLTQTQFSQNQDPIGARASLDRLPEAMKGKPVIIVDRWDYSMLARDYVAAGKAIPNLNRSVAEFPVVEATQFYEACVAFAAGDRERAHGLFEKVRPLYESGARDHPDDPTFHAALGKLYALLGQKEDAVREGNRAVALCPESKDALSGPAFETNLAFIYAQSGEVKQAVALLTHLLTTPAAEGATLARLRLSWEWDALRQDPSFQALITGPEAATIYK